MTVIRQAAAVVCIAAMCLVSAAACADTLTPEMGARFQLEPRNFICPLDGEPFEQATSYPHFPLEPFPDGSHLGDQWVEMQIPKCPTSGLVLLPDFAATRQSEADGLIYHQYSADELAQLPALLADSSWQALAPATRQLRAYWLATQLQRPAEERLLLLLEAPYGASTEQARTLANEAIARDGSTFFAVTTDEDELYGLQDRVIDALRQLGRFDEAQAMLDQLTADYYAAEGIAPDADEEAELTPVELAINQRNSDRFALAMLEGRLRGSACREYSAQTYRFSPRLPIDCEGDRAQRVRYEKTLDGGLDSLDLGFGEEQFADDPLAPADIIAQCEDYFTPQGAGEQTADEANFDDGLYLQCDRYRSAVTQAVAEQLLASDADFTDLCDDILPMMMPGCEVAAEMRTDQRASARLARADLLAADCARVSLYDRPLDLVRACYALEHDGGIAYWQGYSPLPQADADLRALLHDQARTEIARWREALAQAS